MPDPVVVKASIMLQTMKDHTDEGEHLRTTRNDMFFSRHCKCGIKTAESKDRNKVQEDMFRHIIVEAVKNGKKED